MAINGLSAFPQQGALLTTTLANFGDAVAAGKERSYMFMRAVNRSTSDQTVTVMVGTSAIAFEVVIPAKTGLNIIGPEVMGPLPAGTQLQARASVAALVDLFATGSDRVLA